MENPVAKGVDKGDIVHALVAKMGGIVVESKCRMVIQGLKCFFCRSNIKGNLGGMNFQCISNTHVLVGIQNRFPLGCKLSETIFDHRGRGGRKAVEHVPDGTSCKTIYHRNAQSRCGLSGFNDFLVQPVCLRLRDRRHPRHNRAVYSCAAHRCGPKQPVPPGGWRWNIPLGPYFPSKANFSLQ